MLLRGKQSKNHTAMEIESEGSDIEEVKIKKKNVFLKSAVKSTSIPELSKKRRTPVPPPINSSISESYTESNSLVRDDRKKEKKIIRKDFNISLIIV